MLHFIGWHLNSAPIHIIHSDPATSNIMGWTGPLHCLDCFWMLVSPVLPLRWWRCRSDARKSKNLNLNMWTPNIGNPAAVWLLGPWRGLAGCGVPVHWHGATPQPGDQQDTLMQSSVVTHKIYKKHHYTDRPPAVCLCMTCVLYIAQTVHSFCT